MIDLRMNERGLIEPATEADEIRLQAFTPNDLMRVTTWRQRVAETHRAFFADCGLVARTHPYLHSVDDVIRVLKLRTRHCTDYITPNGKVVYELRSISWTAMDEADCLEWCHRARKVIEKELLPQCG